MDRKRMIVRELRGWLLVLSALFLVCYQPLSSQQPGNTSAADKEMLQLLLKRIDQLEARVKQLEAERQQGNTSDSPRRFVARSICRGHSLRPRKPRLLASGSLSPRRDLLYLPRTRTKLNRTI